MSNEFGTSAEDQGTQGNQESQQAPGNEGTAFGQEPDGQTNTNGNQNGIDLAEYEALRKRDENAQEHIPRLESENQELRDKLVELEARLASATTLDEALARIADQGEGQAIDRTDVAQVVREVLGQTQTEEKMEANWTSVVSDLTKKYGEWKNADTYVTERSRELDISLEEATKMAKNNPTAFRKLYDLESTAPISNPAGSAGAGAQGQRGVSSQPGQVRNKEYYKNLLKNDPKKYWSVDTQMQMRKDLYT